MPRCLICEIFDFRKQKVIIEDIAGILFDCYFKMAAGKG